MKIFKFFRHTYKTEKEYKLINNINYNNPQII